MPPRLPVAIAWFRRDLRVRDNRMLAEASAGARRVHPVFVADPQILARSAAAPGRVAWYAANLEALDVNLRGSGSSLTVLHGDPAEALRSFAAEVGADLVYAGRDEEPDAVARDGRVARAVDLRLIDDQRILPSGALRTAAGEPFQVFSAFRNALDRWLDRAGPSAVAAEEAQLDRLAPASGGTGTVTFPAWGGGASLPSPGEGAGIAQLASFVRENLPRYALDRDRPDLDVTSRLSPYLRVGAVSIRAAWRLAIEAERRAAESHDAELRRSARRWRSELAWREFFASVLHERPEVTGSAYRAEFSGVAWEEGPGADEAFRAWREGRTGFPVVDAAMRQLVATGWIHNRLRLISASFLVKDLGIDWRRGEAAFMEHLLDGDVAQNNGNWQWVAGTGTDAAPYFRIFNPTVQGRRFDPQGTYVRMWLPELADLPAVLIHEPWTAKGRTPRDYPSPIVDHRQARTRTLQRYRQPGRNS